MSRKRKIPLKKAKSLKAIPVYSSAKDMYKTLFYKAIQAIIKNVKSRIQQKGYIMVMNLENLLLKCAMGEDFSDEFQKMTDFYDSDLDKNMLQTQLLTFKLLFYGKEKVQLNIP